MFFLDFSGDASACRDGVYKLKHESYSMRLPGSNGSIIARSAAFVRARPNADCAAADGVATVGRLEGDLHLSRRPGQSSSSPQAITTNGDDIYRCHRSAPYGVSDEVRRRGQSGDSSRRPDINRGGGCSDGALIETDCRRDADCRRRGEKARRNSHRVYGG